MVSARAALFCCEARSTALRGLHGLAKVSRLRIGGGQRTEEYSGLLGASSVARWARITALRPSRNLESGCVARSQARLFSAQNVVGLAFHGLFVMGDGLTDLPAPEQGVAQTVAGFREVGLDPTAFW